MPINVDYTPVGEIYEASRVAGSVQGLMQADQMQQQQENFEMRLQAEQQAREWTERMRQEAATEDYQRTLAMAQAKADIDFQTEVAAYQKKRALFMSEVGEIEASDKFTSAQKQEIVAKAYANRLGVTLGNTTMENLLAKQQNKMALVKHVQEQVDLNEQDPTTGMTPEEGRQQLAAAGVPYSNKMLIPEKTQIRDQLDGRTQQLRLIKTAMKDYGVGKEWTQRGKLTVKDTPSSEPRVAQPHEEAAYESLKRRATELMGEIAELEKMAKPAIPQREIDAYLATLPPEAAAGWEIAKAEGMSFQEFLERIGAMPKKPKKPTLFQKISPIGAMGYIAGSE